MRRLRTKLYDLRCALSTVSENFDIIILVETWLNDSITDAELGFDNFNIFRVDRDSINSDYLRGGGVLIAVKNHLFSRVLKLSVASVEQLFVDIRLEHKHIIIGTVYVPPASDLSVYESHCLSVEEVITMLPNADLLIAGDYNLSHTH